MQNSVPSKIKRLHDYWLGLAGGVVPDRTAVDPQEIKDLLPNIMILDIEDDPFRVRFRLTGTRVDDVTGMNITGRYLDELTMDHGAGTMQKLHNLYAECRARGEPFIGALKWPNKVGEATNVSLGVFPLNVDGVITQLLVIEDYSEIAESNHPLQWRAHDKE